MSKRNKHKPKFKKLSNNQKRNNNEWKYNPIRFFNYKTVIDNKPEVELECIRKFNKEIAKYINSVKDECYQKETKPDEVHVITNNLDKGFKKATKFFNVLNYFYRKGGSIRGLCTKYRIAKSSFYQFKKKYDIWKNSKFYSLKNFFPKSTRPQKIQYKYSNKDINYLCDCYFDYHYRDVQVNPSVMQIVCELKFESNKDIYRNLSYATAHKFIKNDPRYKGVKEYKYKLKHHRRKRYIAPGNVQFDLKIIGRKETHHNKPIILATMKDEGSKVVYGAWIKDGTAESVLKVLEDGHVYYKELGITIKRIRTDNAMMFNQRKNNVSNYKKINFINDNLFHEFLNRNDIVHEKIPLGESEANGTIERYHKTIDMELLKKIDACENIDDVGKVYQAYVEWYNFQRYHTNSIHHDDPRIPLYIKPIDFLKELNKLIKTNSME